MSANKSAQIFLSILLVIGYFGLLAETSFTAQKLFPLSLMLGFLILFFPVIDKNKQNIFKFLQSAGLIAVPTELSMFVIAITSLVLSFVFNFWNILWNSFSTGGFWALGAIGYLILGLYLCLYHVAIHRDPTKSEWKLMLIYYIVTIFYSQFIFSLLFVY